MTHLLLQIHFENNFTTGNQGDLRVKKETIYKLLIGLICLKTLFFFLNHAQTFIYFIKNGNEARDVLGDSRKRYRTLQPR